jgi:hypothetical protein
MDPNRKEAIMEAVKPLLDLRQEQAGDLYRVFEGGDGYRPGERKDQFFKHQDPEIMRGPADPVQMPFYVLLVGSPAEIPYKFQYQLDVMRGVGRIDFGDNLEAYARYAQNVTQAETGKVILPRRATLFGVSSPGDKATQLSARYLIRSLYENLQMSEPDGEIKLQFDWQFDQFVGQDQATKAQLQRLLGGDSAQTPALLLTASHGMEFPINHPNQFAYQGALLCQDWPGPGKGISRDHFLAGEDLASDANMLGLIALFFACYGAGTPQWDQFARQAFKARSQIAPHGFIGALPNRLLTQGALAVLGHVERAWGYSFISPSGNVDNQAFVTALRKLLNGEPVGLATDPSFNMRYADMSSALSANLEELEWTPDYIDDYELAHIWTANNDARGYVVLGDPAARIPFARPDETPTERPDVGTVSVPTLSPVSEAEVQSPPAEPSSAPPADAESFVVAFGLQDQFGNLSNSVREFTRQLAQAMGKAAEDILTLEVKTYTTSNLETLTKRKLRARTHVAFDGDTDVYVPEKAGEVDQDLWQIHIDMVREAQNNRAQFLSAMAELATNLLKSMT